MKRAMLTLLWLFSASYVQASIQADDEKEWVRTFWLTPTSKPEMKLFVVRDSEMFYGFGVEPMPDGTNIKTITETRWNYEFKGGKPSYMGLTATSEGNFSRENTIDQFRQQLQKLGTITREIEGPATIQLDFLEAIMLRYTDKYPNNVKLM